MPRTADVLVGMIIGDIRPCRRRRRRYEIQFLYSCLVVRYRMQEACQPKNANRETDGRPDFMGISRKKRWREVSAWRLNGKKSSHIPCTVCNMLPMNRPHRFLKSVWSLLRRRRLFHQWQMHGEGGGVASGAGDQALMRFDDVLADR